VIVAPDPLARRVADEERVDAGVAVILDVAIKALEHAARMDALPVRCELGIGDPVQVAEIDPHAPALHAAGMIARLGRHGCVVEAHQRARQ
jgi:hypothetical protein